LQELYTKKVKSKQTPKRVDGGIKNISCSR